MVLRNSRLNLAFYSFRHHAHDPPGSLRLLTQELLIFLDGKLADHHAKQQAPQAVVLAQAVFDLLLFPGWGKAVKRNLPLGHKTAKNSCQQIVLHLEDGAEGLVLEALGFGGGFFFGDYEGADSRALV